MRNKLLKLGNFLLLNLWIESKLSSTLPPNCAGFARMRPRNDEFIRIKPLKKCCKQVGVYERRRQN